MGVQNRSGAGDTADGDHDTLEELCTALDEFYH